MSPAERASTPTQKSHVPWTAADLLNSKALLPPLSKDPAKCKEGFKKILAIHNPTYRGLVGLLRGVIPAHDYTVIIRQARRPPGENPSLSKQMARNSPRPSGK